MEYVERRVDTFLRFDRLCSGDGIPEWQRILGLSYPSMRQWVLKEQLLKRHLRNG